MADYGIQSCGAYIPRLRLERAEIAQAHSWMAPSLRGLGKGQKAFPSWDEDPVTMGVEAARDALAGIDLSNLDTIGFASTRAPYADLQSSSIIAGALNLPDKIAATDFANSQRAGSSGLLQLLKTGSDALFIASDAPIGRPASPQEMSYGAGAAAFKLGEKDIIAKFIGAGSVTDNFVDHFRAADDKYDYFWEDRWVRDEAYLKLAPRAIVAALENAKLDIGDIDYFLMPSLLRGGAKTVSKAIKFSGEVEDEIAVPCGYAGTAHALLLLASALERANPGERILLVGFGQGADAIIFETTPAIIDYAACRGVNGSIAEGVTTDNYLRLLSFAESIDLEWGMRAEKDTKTALTEQYRSADQLENFKAGKCSNCGTIQFPQLAYCVNPKCGVNSKNFTSVSLINEPAKVLTYTADWLSYHPAPPLYVGFIQFENGARVLMEIVDVEDGKIDIGTPVRIVFRIKEKDNRRGYNRYFWKATPVKS